MEPEMTNEQPVSEPVVNDAPTDNQATAAPSSDEPAAASDADAAEEAVPQDSEAPITNENDSDDIEEDLSPWDSYLPQQPQSAQPQVGEDGYIDPVAFKEGIKGEVREEIRFERAEARAWGKLEEKYPQLKDDAELREIILAKRINDVQTGGDGSLIKSGESVMQKFTTARNSGKADAQVNVRKQKAAGLNTPTAPRSTADKDVQQRIRSGDPEAIASVLSGWVSEGKI